MNENQVHSQLGLVRWRRSFNNKKTGGKRKRGAVSGMIRMYVPSVV